VSGGVFASIPFHASRSCFGAASAGSDPADRQSYPGHVPTPVSTPTLATAQPTATVDPRVTPAETATADLRATPTPAAPRLTPTPGTNRRPIYLPSLADRPH
jgi:hypothetical protein